MIASFLEKECLPRELTCNLKIRSYFIALDRILCHFPLGNPQIRIIESLYYEW